jgi:hypothetical protein
LIKHFLIVSHLRVPLERTCDESDEATFYDESSQILLELIWLTNQIIVRVVLLLEKELHRGSFTVKFTLTIYY